MRSSTLPLPAKKTKAHQNKKNFYHISFASECQRCFETCVKPRRLPCEHEFCKSCLKEYFNKDVEDNMQSNTFPCPACDTPIDKPLMPKSKWTKAFKIDNSTRFYAGRPSSTSSVERATTQPLDRFTCKINTEQFPCAFWGGDVGPTGELFLPDWYNQTVKVFTDAGRLVASTKFSAPPLDVTVLPGPVCTCVVSYGRVQRLVTLVDYDQGTFSNSRNVALDGNLYSTTRLSQKCLGILEVSGRSTVTLAIISVKPNAKQIVRTKDIGPVSASLSSASGVGYDATNKRIYLTEKTNLICLDSAGKLLFEKSYPRSETTHFPLGSVACDQRGSVYLASDTCLLHVDTGGRHEGHVLTTIDPYHVMVSRDGQKLFAVGRNDRVEICSAELRTFTEA